MKRTIQILLLLAMGLSVLMISSCQKPTVPNFEEYGVPSNVWDYNHVIWFDLDYQDDAPKGIANVDIWMSAKGVNPNATLKIGTQTINFDEITSYTDGKIYFGGNYSLNTDQPVNYVITDQGNEYTGSISILPKRVVVPAWPAFNQTTNYSPSWSISQDPQFHVIDSGIYGTETELDIVRQIPGTQKTYTMIQSLWAPYLPVEEFFFGANAVGYEMLNKNKVLIVGATGNYYYFSAFGKGLVQQMQRKPFRFMDLIQADINK